MSNKGWSVLFGVTMLGCAIGFAISPWVGWWMPEGVSTHAHEVDFLFHVILWITTFFFFLTEGILVAFLWKYSGTSDHSHPVSRTKEYPGFMKPLTNLLHDQHRVELAWTFVPAVILLYIAFAQVNTWADIKYATRNQGQMGDSPTQQVAISARQFEWRMRYPGVARFNKWMADKNPNAPDYTSFGKVPQVDDVYVVNELHVWMVTKEEVAAKKGSGVMVSLTTRDVIHSLNLPNFRVKQDALPGKMIPVWFKATKANCKGIPIVMGMGMPGMQPEKRWVDGVDPETGEKDKDLIYDIPCAELCGWGHYRMIGRVYVHKDQADFLAWLEFAEKVSRQRTRD